MYKQHKPLAVGDRVQYVPGNWPERTGWTGTIIEDRGLPAYCGVQFDQLPNWHIGVYCKNLIRER